MSREYWSGRLPYFLIAWSVALGLLAYSQTCHAADKIDQLELENVLLKIEKMEMQYAELVKKRDILIKKNNLTVRDGQLVPATPVVAKPPVAVVASPSDKKEVKK